MGWRVLRPKKEGGFVAIIMFPEKNDMPIPIFKSVNDARWISGERPAFSLISVLVLNMFSVWVIFEGIIRESSSHGSERAGHEAHESLPLLQ